MGWENYGDINPIEHGGVFVKKDVHNGREYMVIHLTPFYDDGEKWLIIDAYVDLNDDWIDWDDVKSTMGTPDNADDKYLATDVVHYYGTHCSNGEQLILESEEEVLKWLSNVGINAE